MGWYRKEAGAIVVTVRLTPKSDRDAIMGVGQLSDDTEILKIRVRALPEDGAANAALVRLVAKSLKVPKSAVAIATGAQQRVKQVRVSGDPVELSRRIEGLVK